ncbi:UDP-N-acetyl-D-mannosamine dehydrogenase [Paenarthrobacter sp. Z7-10]|uniref:UDP-N-acetyl-D-mannosamine dehydrogenase n=1 Tax=Paenarthrobacter sp. Z7-10 TaxID=2787635 RepID=UPI002E794B9B|nr:UDP-N-acetyl-D-mannosamine dehydrogenase [Paenarthrobacter sp. Z7-10]
MSTLIFKPGETPSSVTRVAVIGLGYIGLPTAAILAGKGLEVIGVDVNAAVVDAVNQGIVPFVEPDLGIHVAGAVSQGLLSAQLKTPVADAYIVAVPTPFTTEKTADLKFVQAAAESIAPNLRGGELIILESTSPPGTTQRMADYVLDLRPDLRASGEGGRTKVMFAHCPERVLPGRIMIELVTNDRIVGGLTAEAANVAAALYSTFCQGDIHLTDATTAEMAKLVENAYRDVNIAFANELSMISSKLGIDVWDLIDLANHHPRVNILEPGPGVGGHCIAVDPWFIVAADPTNSSLIRTARMVNDSKPAFVEKEVAENLIGLERPTIAALGLAFKANIDDMRESAAVEIVRRLARSYPESTILVAAPHEMGLPADLACEANVHHVETDVAVAEADVVVLLVDHDRFREIDARQLHGKRVVDTRGFWR